MFTACARMSSEQRRAAAATAAGILVAQLRLGSLALSASCTERLSLSVSPTERLSH